MMHPRVERLLGDCPFLADHMDRDNLDLPTVIFGHAARLLVEHKLPPEQEDMVFDHFNRLAEAREADVFDVLGTGAIEIFNDDAASQQLARRKLSGRALVMLEDFRRYWGQPDYGGTA